LDDNDYDIIPLVEQMNELSIIKNKSDNKIIVDTSKKNDIDEQSIYDDEAGDDDKDKINKIDLSNIKIEKGEFLLFNLEINENMGEELKSISLNSDNINAVISKNKVNDNNFTEIDLVENAEKEKGKK
jgi:hypothetical protein